MLVKMTLSTLQTLASTDDGRERIRVMVAELHGCVEIADHGNGLFCKRPRPSGGELSIYPVPRYTESLNACAEFEAGLTDEEHYQFRVHIWEMTDPERDSETKVRIGGWAHNRAYFSASALPRCIALILTKQPTKGAE